MAYWTHPFINAPYAPTITSSSVKITKLACHCTARYKIEWIYTQTKMRGGGSLELAQETRKKERLTNGYFLNIWFWHVHVYTIVLMNDLGLNR